MTITFYLNGKIAKPERRNGVYNRPDVDTIAIIYQPNEFDQAISHQDVALCACGRFHIEGVKQLEDVIILCTDGRSALFTAAQTGATVARPFTSYCSNSITYQKNGWFEFDVHLICTYNDRNSFKQFVQRYINISETNWENALKAHRQAVLYLKAA